MKHLLLFIVVFFSPILSLSQVDLNLGLRAYYPFNGNANDVSGNNNNPVFNNATLTTDRWGNANSAFHFNGVDNYMRIPNSPSMNTSGTISVCAFVRATGYYTGPCHGNSILMKGYADYLPGNYLLRFDDNFYTSGVNCSTSIVDIAHDNFYGAGTVATPPGYTPYVQTNQWHSVIATYDGTTAKLYVDCELKISSPQNGLTFTGPDDLILGALENANYPYWLNGDLDEVRIYDRPINLEEVKAISGCGSIVNCNDWLHTQVSGQSVKIGDLDVSGNQITIEANINRTSPYAGNYLYAGDIVSKHQDNANCNYLLRPNSAEITTSNGYFVTAPTCDIELNKTYHVALVYNGTTLKFYRNGFLMSQVPATGNLFLNNIVTTIGDYAMTPPIGTNFIGYINEVRIWNVARTQGQIRANMNSALPSPTTQAGLLAYYTFDNLLNKQGNAALNGTLNGGATINNTNSNCSFNADSCQVIVTTTSFTAPDTVCLNTPVQVVNTSVGTSNYYWTFCETDFPSTPNATNLGNVGGVLSWPVFTDLVEDNGVFYVFVVNNYPSGLTCYNYGSSYLNTPTTSFLGNLGGILPGNAEGIQLVKVNGNWIGVLVGGSPASGNPSELVTMNFGPSLDNPTPTATNWGNIGNLLYPIDLFVFTENNNWYGYTVNSGNNTLTRFDFGADFSATPIGTNLGNIGNLDKPVGIGQVNDGVNWHLFITNEGPSNSLTRLDFGSSLLNTPAGVNLGNPGGFFHKARDISFINLCDGISALSVNGETNTITKLDFQNNLLGVPIPSSLGNLGTLNFPHSISKLFRENNDIYAFIPNVSNYTLTRLQFPGTCTSIPSSTLQTPGPVTYTQTGTYNIHLVTDIGLPTQNSFCKKIFVKDCAVQGISNIINAYTPVLAFNQCKNSLTVEDGTAYNIGDTVLLIQMKGAVVDSTNTATFGNIIDYKNAGNYEFNYVKAKTGNIIELKNKLTRQYDIPVGKVQLIRVPYYTSTTVSGTLTCLPWDGSKGGVLVLNARDTVTLNANIDVSAKGFPGAIGQNNIHPPVLNCFESNFYYLGTSYDSAATKGEGISTVSFNRILGKGKIANAGGGGNSHNSGGGGGSNFGTGGLGGYQFEGCGAPLTFDNRGIGGTSLQYNNISNKIFMGGGGGAGQSNNPEGFTSNGGNGGAIAIIMAGTLINNGNNINNNGQDAESCSLGGTGCHEGMGGGGGAGATLLKVPNFVNNVNINSIGGNGADMVQAGNQRVGPGGGGGGGIVWFNTAIQPGPALTFTTGGLNGNCPAYGNDAWGSTPGNNGTKLFSLVIPVDTVLFKPNIDSVRIKDSNIICRSFNFNGFGYTNTTGIAAWHWNFGDAATADVQNASHTYSANGTFNVTLIITDINGCKDSIIKQVTVVNCANNISNIINDYTPVLSLNPCNNSVTVQDATQFNTGDTVLLIQMKGAQIDSTNATSFGTVTNYKNAGNYEYNFVLSKTGNAIKLKNKLTRQYDLPGGRVQLIRVPYYTSTVVTSTLTCLPWDGTKGGVLAFNVKDTLTLTADIDVNAKGFRGGGTGNGFQCGQPEYAFSFNTGFKGEGISELAGTWNAGGGHVANGGGGCFGGNSGAGGGGNLVPAGMGGQEYTGCGTLQGLGGQALTNNLNTKIYLGGGGGGGQQDNGFPIFNGGNGGGIVFISSNYIKGNSYNISSNGQSRPDTIHDEGGAAGGAGGSIILVANNVINTVNLNVVGGVGNSNFNTSFPFDCHGPGGGGSGGVVFFKQPFAMANTAINSTGGLAGLVLNPSSACYNTTHGGTFGINGGPLFNFVLNVDTVLFKANIDSVRIQNSQTSCTGFDFHGFGYTNTDPIATWDWDLGDGNHANTQNTSHAYPGAGPYTVHLVATDINGCKDSITTSVTPTQVVVNAGPDTSFCSNGAVTHILHGTTTGTGYTWTPSGLLDNNTLQNPTATISTTTMFYLNTSSGLGCNAIDSVLLTVNPLPAVATINDFSICKLDSMLLTTAGTATTYQWTPTLSVNNPSISNPYFHDTISQQMIVTGTITATGCFKKDTVNVTIKPLPLVISIPDTSLCGVHNVTLTTTGAQTYSWLPPTGLSNSGIANPVFTGNSTQTFIVTGAGNNACKANDTITITVHPQPAVSTINDISICHGDSVQLTSNSTAESNQWTPALSVNNPAITNPYFHDTVSQQMIITGTNATGCFAKDTVNIAVKPLPVVQTIPDSALCGAHNVTLTTTGAQGYSWLPAANLSNAGIANPVFTGTSTQTYTVTGTGANACKASDTVTITINAVPVLNTISNTSICKGDSIQLTSNSNAASNHWSPATSVSNPTITNPYFIDTVSQTMIITGTNNITGCFSTASVNITVKPTPNVRSIPDFTSCAVNTVTLTTTGAQTYSWTPANNLDDPAIANPVFSGTTGTYTYSVTGTAPNGCISKDTVTVIIAAKPVFNAPENKTICVNESVQLDGNNGTSYEYLWIPAIHLSNATIVDPMADPVTTTTYTLLVRDETCNYDSTFSVRVTVNPLPIVSATRSNDLDCSTPESQLTAFGASQYSWIPAEGLNDQSIYNPIASPYVTTQYIVVGTDNNGCSNKDTVIVRRKGGKYFGFNVPNSFTPNRDGLNDCWGVTYWGETKNFHLMIFNRWGEKVFETHNVSECWDGIYKGNPSSVGNYVFYLTGETLCGNVTRKGNLLLIR